jgi:poly(hydroxyalkanoate) depolymerase family esterase
MNTPLGAAIGEAMTRLRSSDVAGATAALHRALAGQSDFSRGRSEAGESRKGGLENPLPRRLGDVLKALQAGRTHSAPNSPEADRRPEPDESNGRFSTRSFRGAAGSANYKLYLPADHAGRELALVVMLHGCTQDPDDFARGTRMNTLADEFGLIIAYPHQPRSANAQGCWNWFDARHQRRGAGEPAVIAGLAEALASEFGIDRDHVFVAGLSAGGAMADILASTYPDVFCAAGIHSGLPHGSASDVMSAFAAMKGNAKAVSPKREKRARTIIFHGTADITVHPANGKALFDRVSSQHGALQELATKATVSGKRVTRSVVGPAAGPAIAEYWIIEGGGHAWSGGDDNGSYADASGPDASREMIRFFLDC